MVDANRLPGFKLPGPADPGPRQPGPAFPDPSTVGSRTVSTTNAAVDATGTTTIGTPAGSGGDVVEVRVTATAADFSFNVNADGTALFDSAQSPSGTTEETFTVPADNAPFDGDAPDLVFEVTSASSSGGATADVDVDVSVAEQ